MSDRQKQQFIQIPKGDLQSPQEMLCQAGAIRLAKRLERYWHEKGYKAARFWAEPIGERFSKIGTYDLYKVSCNLVKGLPPVYRDE